MADVMQARMWLTDENFERCTAVRTETVGYSIERRRVPGFHPLLENTSHDEEVTRLWALEEIPFAVPAGARVSHVVVKVGGFEIPAKLGNDATDFPSAGTFNVWPLNMHVAERLSKDG